jgi:hypothetical protein
MTTIIATLQSHFPLARTAPQDFPLFPTANGQIMTHTELLLAVSEIIDFMGLKHFDLNKDGSLRRQFAEDLFRVSGAQMLARADIELYMIQLIGRWGSSAVTRYVQDAPLCRQGCIATQVARHLDAMQDCKPPAMLFNIPAAAAPVQRQPTPSHQKGQLHFLKNENSGCLHYLPSPHATTSTDLWTTKCGKRYTNWSFRTFEQQPCTDCWLCTTCFNNNESDSSSSSSSSGSSSS